MCSFFGPCTDSMKHNFTHGGPAVLENSMFGVASTVNWEMDLGLGFGVSIFCFKLWGFEVGLWGLGF